MMPAWISPVFDGMPLGWMLVHSVWIAAALACVGWFADILSVNIAPRYRHRIFMSLLFSVPIASLFAAAHMENRQTPTSWKQIPQRVLATTSENHDLQSSPKMTITSAALEATTDFATTDVVDPAKHRRTPNATFGTSWFAHSQVIVPKFFSWLVPLWLLGVLTCWARLWMQWLALRRLIRDATLPSLPIQQAVANVRRRLGVHQKVLIRICDQLAVPAVVGCLRPTLLLPASLCSNLTPLEFDAILAHELAHIRRFDWLLNLLQLAVETLFFFHPAVWWLSRRIREERENACDDIGIHIVGDRLAYANALTRLATWSVQHHLSLSANGGDFTARIHRIVGRRQNMKLATIPWSSFLCLALICTYVACNRATSTPVSNASSQKQSPATRSTSDKHYETIAGRVVDANKKPLANADIYLQQTAWNETPKRLAQTRTDPSGHFEFQDVQHPNHADSITSRIFPIEIVVRKPGYAVRWQRLRRENTELAFQLKPEFEFAGRVHDADGNPATQVRVYVDQIMSLNTISKIDIPGGNTPHEGGDSFLSLGANQQAISATTNDKGEFRLRELPRRVGLVLRTDDQRFVNTPIYAATTDESLPKIATSASYDSKKMRTAEDRITRRGVSVHYESIRSPGATLVVSRGKTVTLRMVDADTSLPVEGVSVQMMADLIADPLTTDDSGTVQFFRLPLSKMVVQFTPPNESPYLGLTKTIVLDQMDSSHTVRLSSATEWAGRVTEESSAAPIANAEVQYRILTYQADQYVSHADKKATTDADGVFRLWVPRHQEGQNCVVSVSAPDGYRAVENLEATTDDGSPTLPHQIKLDTADNPTEPLAFSFRKNPTIGFAFVDEQDNAIPATVTARLYSTTGRSRTENTAIAADQTYDAGSLIFRNNDGLDRLRLLAVSQDRRRAAVHYLTDFAAAEPTTQLTLQPTASVFGVVRNSETGKPIADAAVSLGMQFEFGYGQNVSQTRTDDAGQYRFDALVPDLEYLIGVSAADYEADNSFHHRFREAASGSREINIDLVPQVPGNLADLAIYEVPDFPNLSAEETFDKLAEEYQTASAAYEKLLANTKNSAARNTIVQRREPTNAFVQAFAELAAENRDTDVELKSLLWICNARNVAGTYRDYAATKKSAADRIVAAYADRAELGEHVPGVIYNASDRYPAAQKLMQSPIRVVQANAHFIAGQLFATHEYPGMELDEVMRTKAIEHYQTVVDQFADVPHWRFDTLGEAAKRKLFALQQLRIGQPAPEISGTDLDGQPMKLSDYRGQTVVLHYWEGAMHDFERIEELRSAFPSDDIAIVGICTTESIADALAAAKDLPESILHWHDPDHQIHSRWCDFWTCSQVIDRHGTIIYLGRPNSTQQLAAAIERAQAEAKVASVSVE
ncbi:MAG: M56 family metallopeptidase [Pirellulaceae bacterium]